MIRYDDTQYDKQRQFHFKQLLSNVSRTAKQSIVKQAVGIWSKSRLFCFNGENLYFFSFLFFGIFCFVVCLIKLQSGIVIVRAKGCTSKKEEEEKKKIKTKKQTKTKEGKIRRKKKTRSEIY